MQPQKTQAAPNAGTQTRKVLVDGNTIELARRLGISVEEYLDRVVHFFLHPPQEPLLSVIENPDPQPQADFQELRCASQRKAG